MKGYEGEMDDFQLPTGIDIVGGRIEAFKSLQETRAQAQR